MPLTLIPAECQYLLEMKIDRGTEVSLTTIEKMNEIKSPWWTWIRISFTKFYVH